MFFSIDPANGIAIYDQITRQIKFAVASGVLEPGELVPSVRELARQLAVNPNTVSRAYGKLQTDEVLSMVRGTGLQVTKKAPQRCRRDRIRLIRERLQSVLMEARHSQLDSGELQDLVDEEMKRLNGKGTTK